MQIDEIRNNLIEFIKTLPHPRGYEFKVMLNSDFRQFVDDYWDCSWGIPKNYLEKLWYAIHKKIPICEKGNRLNWYSWEKGYAYCNKSCFCAKKSREKSMMDRYGVKYPLQNPSLAEKAKKTWIEKYGTDKLSSINISKKINTNLERYGTEYPLQSTEIQNKTSNSLLNNSGFTKPFKNLNIQEKIQKSWVEINGGKSYKRTLSDAKNAQVSLLTKKFGDRSKILLDPMVFTDHLKIMSRIELANFIGCCLSLIDKRIKEWNLIEFQSSKSHYEIVINNFLTSLNIDFIENTRKIIPPKEIDWWLPNFNLGIEFCGLRWHGERVNRGKYYHLSKLTSMNALGYKLIQIFQDEWDSHSDIIKNLIGSELRLLAKKYIDNFYIIEVDNNISQDFLIKYHIDGPTSSDYCLGLFDLEHNLTALMSATEMSKDVWLIDRYANKFEYNSSNLFSNLVAELIKHKSLDKMIYTVDKRYPSGLDLLNNNFELSVITEPNYWYTFGTFRSKTANLHLDQLTIDDKFSKLSIEQLFKIDKIWDCGYEHWIWSK